MARPRWSPWFPRVLDLIAYEQNSHAATYVKHSHPCGRTHRTIPTCLIAYSRPASMTLHITDPQVQTRLPPSINGLRCHFSYRQASSEPERHALAHPLFTVVALASIARAARARISPVREERRQDHHPTDGMPPECNRLNFHGAARMQRGSRSRRADLRLEEACFRDAADPAQVARAPSASRRRWASNAKLRGSHSNCAATAQTRSRCQPMPLPGTTSGHRSAAARARCKVINRPAGRISLCTKRSVGLCCQATPFAWSQEMHATAEVPCNIHQTWRGAAVMAAVTSLAMLRWWLSWSSPSTTSPSRQQLRRSAYASGLLPDYSRNTILRRM